jgi:hypothetical protein
VSPRLPRPPSEQQAAAPDVWAFLQESSPEAGVVLVGFGATGLFGNALDHTDFVELAAGFSALGPTRVLWPLIPSNLPEGTSLEQLPLGENVKVVPWIDYNDVLGEGRSESTGLMYTVCDVFAADITTWYCHIMWSTWQPLGITMLSNSGVLSQVLCCPPPSAPPPPTHHHHHRPPLHQGVCDPLWHPFKDGGSIPRCTHCGGALPV